MGPGAYRGAVGGSHPAGYERGGPEAHKKRHIVGNGNGNCGVCTHSDGFAAKAPSKGGHANIRADGRQQPEP